MSVAALLLATVTVGTRLELPGYSFLYALEGGRESLAAADRRVEYDPAFSPNAGVSVDWGTFHFSWTVKLDATSDSYKAERGTTDYDDLRMSKAWKWLVGEAFYQRYKGFHTDLNANSGFTVSQGDRDTVDTVNDDAQPKKPPDYRKRPDIASVHAGASLLVPIPVVREGTDVGVWQILHGAAPVSARSVAFEFVVGGYYDWLEIEANGPIVPEERREAFGAAAGLDGVAVHGSGITGGLAGLLGFSEAWHFAMGMTLGGGGARQRATFADADPERKNGEMTAFNLKMQLGRKGESTALGLGVFWDIYSYQIREASLDSTAYGLATSYALSF